jgi:diaminohydroxyphosphoribosylaminopyrimidine deaminase/5-amino-6-(5-phosphoribosylamino)uracil reductase
MIEGGHGDQVAAFIAPKIVGGKDALSPVTGEGLAPMAQALQLTEVRTRRCGPDLLLRGFLP